MDANPLLDFSRLPRYGSIRTEHVAPAIDELLVQNRALIAELTAEGMPASWEGFAEPLERANERLGRAWGAVGHLHAVDDNPAIRDAYKVNLPKVTRYYTELAQNLDLYGKFKALRASRDFENLSAARRKIVDNNLRDYRLGGAELPPEKKARFAEIQEELAALEAKFSENLLDATNAFGGIDHRPRAASRHPGGRSSGGRGVRSKGRQGGLEAHASRAFVRPGDAICRESRS
jgi:oligopeptidase A